MNTEKDTLHWAASGLGWRSEKGFLFNDGSSDQYCISTPVTTYHFASELHKPNHFRIYLNTSTSGKLLFEAEIKAEQVQFVFAGPEPKEQEGNELSNDRKKILATHSLIFDKTDPAGTQFILIQVWSTDTQYNVIINNHLFTLNKVDIKDLTGGIQAGGFGIFSATPEQRWAWLCLSTKAELALPQIRNYQWKGVDDSVKVSDTSQVESIEMSDISLEQHKPRITKIVPQDASPGEVIRIYGIYFPVTQVLPQYSIEEHGPYPVTSVASNMVEIKVPEFKKSLKQARLSIHFAEEQTISPEEFRINVTPYSFYNILTEAPKARWRNGSTGNQSILVFGQTQSIKNGFAREIRNVKAEDGMIYTHALHVHPPDPDLRYMHGFFRDCFVHAGDKLFLTFGFVDGANQSDGVKFRISFYHRTRRKWYDIMPYYYKKYNGHLESREIELETVLPLTQWWEKYNKPMKGAFALRVEPGSNGRDDDALWITAKIGTPMV